MAIWRKDQRNYYKRTGGALGKKPTSRAERDAVRRERDAARAARGPAGQVGSGTQEPQSVAATQQDPQPTPGAQTTSMASSRKTNPWGATAVPSSYKPGTNAPRFFSHQPTETKEDMEARREAIEGLRENPTAFGGTGEHDADVLAAIASHGTVEASQRGMYSGRTVQPASEKLGGGLTDRQREGIDRSVRAEFDARVNAKMNGVAFTGAHSAEEQQKQADAYKSQVEKFRSDYAAAHPELADAIAKNNPPESAAPSSGTVTRTFAPGVGGYAVSAGQAGAKPEVQQSERATATSPAASGQSEVDKAIADAEKLVADLDEKYGDQPPGEPEDEFGATADAKGGKTSGRDPAPVVQSHVPEVLPERPAPAQGAPELFHDPYEAALAISSSPDMDYADLVSAAYAVASPTPADGGDYDPEAVFRGVLAPRIESDLIAGIDSMRALEDEASARYHGANSRAVMQACGATEAEYGLAAGMASAGDPSELLRMQMKFMDSF